MLRRFLVVALAASAAAAVLIASVPAPALAGTRIVPLSAGAFHTCALTPSGGAMCWGSGGDGELGSGFADSNTPVGVTGLGSGIAAISAGFYHTCALTVGGGARCWGDNSHGQLGDGTTDASGLPVSVSGFVNSGLEAISGGEFHTCAITSAGAATCWGRNGFGQLGDGSTSDRFAPVAIPTLTSGVSAIAAGEHHTCAITGGEVWCWGENFYGQLGDGTTVERHSPVAVALPADAIAVAPGEGHTCALVVGGAVLCWGDNGFGQLGDGTFEESHAPIPVTGLDSGVAAISTRGNTTCALTTGGGVLCWGDNIRGMVGDGTNNNVRGEPQPVVGLTSGVAEIAAGYYHSCALTTSGTVKCWGFNLYGELGDGTNTNSNVPVDVLGSFAVTDSTPPVIALPGDIVAEADSPAGASVTFAVTFSDPDDAVATSGCTPASGATFPFGPTPVTCTATDSHGNSASATFQVTVVDTTPPTISEVPDDITVVAGPSGDAVVDYPSPAATDLVTAAILVGCAPPSGSAFSLGSTVVHCSASDGNGNTAHASFTVTVVEPLPIEQKRLTAGAGQTCATKSAGSLYCWGYNNHGQVGDGNAPINALAAVPVPGLDSGVASVSGGRFHTCALTVQGKASCWGYTRSGQVGNGSFGADVLAPVGVVGLDSGVASLSAGGLHTCALTTRGGVSCWGYNASGQLGDGTHENRSVPTPVGGLASGVIAVDASGDHTCAVVSGGAVRCWGSNLYGQLGGATTAEDSVVPVPVTGLQSDVVAIDASSTFTCAITTAGDVKCWGVNFYGQLGDGTFDNSPTPVSVVGLPGPVRAIAAGEHSTCALTTLGAVWCWGRNGDHELGNDSDDPVSPTPVPVTGLGSGVIAIAGGESHFCALSAGPFIQCWGWNPTGALGDGTLTTRAVPTAVHHFGADASIGDITVDEGDAGTTPATFTISLSEASTETVTVLWSTLGIDAFADQDYEGAVGTATFAPGDTSEQISVNVIGDTDVESDEQFSVRLERAANAAIEIDTGIATIRNDDVPGIAIDDVSVPEGDAGSTPATFAITLDRPSIHPVTVAWATAAVDALAGEDFAAASGVVTFAPGDVHEPVTVDVYGDTRFEPDETFQVVLSNPTQAVIVDGTGTATIVNDESNLAADVAITKTADHSTTNPVAPGQILVYTVSVTNLGPGTATNVQITDALPGGSTPTDARWCEPLLTSGTCSTSLGDPYDSSTAIPPIATLPSGEHRTFRIGYTVAADLARGTIQNRASVETSSTDPNSANDASTATVLVDAPPVASFSWSPALPVAGGPVRFDGTASSDDLGIARYEWRFGGGGTATGPTAGHSFGSDGAYTVELRVTDAYGRESLASQRVEVAPNTAPSAHRALTGIVSQLVSWGPGAEPAATSLPLAGATVTTSSGGGQVLTTATDSAGTYGFVNLGCGPNCAVAVRSNGTIVALPPTFQLGPDPSTTFLDITAGDQVDRLFLSGRVVAPDDPSRPAPMIAIRVYRGANGGVLLADSGVLYGGRGSWGTYRLALGRVGSGNTWQPGGTLRVVLVENGTEVRSTTVTIPSQTGAAVQVTAADLVGADQTPSAHRALTGSVTRLLGWGPGAEPAAPSAPLGGATVTTAIGGGQTLTTSTDSAGIYGFVNLTCGSNCTISIQSNGTIVALPPRFQLGPDPSTTVLDVATGAEQNQLFLSGRVVEPANAGTHAATVAVRVYRGNSNGALLADSSVLYGGSGGWGTYRLALGIVGTTPYQVGAPLRIVLVENGVEVRSTMVTVPAQTYAAVQVTASDLVGIDPTPSAGRALTGTVTQLVDWGPGGEPGATSRPLAGATVTVAGSGSATLTTTTDGRGVYAFVNLKCGNGCAISVRSGDAIVALPPKFSLGPDPSTTVVDVVAGTQPNQLYLFGRTVAPDPAKQAPVVSIRVYRSSALLADSIVRYGGVGGWGTYRLALGVAGTNPYQVGTTLRVVLVENGVEVRSTTVTVPALTYTAVQMTAADLAGQ